MQYSIPTASVAKRRLHEPAVVHYPAVYVMAHDTDREGAKVEDADLSLDDIRVEKSALIRLQMRVEREVSARLLTLEGLANARMSVGTLVRVA